ncbi:hypothetical protein FK268_12610 [Tsukamurella sputi]|uniref:Phage major capsid protein n=1 Tax=Tsukamurella sputi TaxID=2591848 RepID=A0A5C5RP72_9ACTN|nr:hypothetical protein [Tsukamurella sputi]TWS24424.1 hypothetical protein FK268_12610 [Tsukamurella sputi]
MPLLFVQPPTIRPAKYGLITAADAVTPEDSAHFQEGVQWQATPRGDEVVEESLVLDGPSPARVYGDWAEYATAGPLVLAALVKVKAPTHSDEEVRAYARQKLLAGESAALEKWAWANGSPALTAGATDLGSVGSIADAVGALEGHAWAKYAGSGVIHAPRALGALASEARLVEKTGGQCVTPLESRWSFGAYPEARKLCITGPLALRTSAIEVFPVDRSAGAFDPLTNDLAYIAQRTYVLAHDCTPAVVTIT